MTHGSLTLPPRLGLSLSRRGFQRGYLLEIPLILFVLVIALSLVMPRLPILGQKIAIVIAAIPIVFCLFYMIVVPGWVPGTQRRAGLILRMTLFLGCAAAIVTGVGAFILR
jgi:hypothetical protein